MSGSGNGERQMQNARRLLARCAAGEQECPEARALYQGGTGAAETFSGTDKNMQDVYRTQAVTF